MEVSSLQARKEEKQMNDLSILLSGTNLTRRGMGGGEIHPSTNILILGLEACFAAKPIIRGSGISSYSFISSKGRDWEQQADSGRMNGSKFKIPHSDVGDSSPEE